MRYLFVCLLLVWGGSRFSYGQTTHHYRVLFLGNSYVYTNNLPQMLADIATSTGDTVVFDSNTPGGHTLQGHSTNPTSLAKIAQGNWDYVVLQEQSQRPAFSDAQVAGQVFPYARKLDTLIRTSNPCAETVFFMTRGYKNGDANNCGVWPPICTYEGMDSMLRARYLYMADENEAIVSPVGAVWRYLRQNHPGINLYSADNSHPDVPGTYAAALSFYTVLFRKDPTAVTYNSTLDAATATNIKNAVKTVVYTQLPQWFVGTYDPVADFTYTATDGYVNFNNLSSRADTYIWDFGDGSTGSNAEEPQHAYWTLGTHTVTLLASRCGQTDSVQKNITISTLGMEANEISSGLSVWPNPAKDVLHICTVFGNEPFDIQIVSLSGKTVYRANTITGEKQDIDISGLKAGTYIIHIYRNQTVISTRKWIKAE